MTFWLICANIHRFVIQPLQNPPLCRSTQKRRSIIYISYKIIKALVKVKKLRKFTKSISTFSHMKLRYQKTRKMLIAWYVLYTYNVKIHHSEWKYVNTDRAILFYIKFIRKAYSSMAIKIKNQVNYMKPGYEMYQYTMHTYQRTILLVLLPRL
jgi:hypothetical protein